RAPPKGNALTGSVSRGRRDIRLSKREELMKAFWACAVAVLVSSCKSGGIEGESCLSHGDCSSGLVCQTGVCRTGVANISPTGKVCVSPMCTVDAQCSGSQKCVDEKCTCMVDGDCFFGSKCSGGACVE